MTPHDIGWLQRCYDIAEHLNTLDIEEWAINPIAGRVLLTTENGLELTIRLESHRIIVTGWFGDAHQFAPRKLTTEGYVDVRYRITEDAQKADQVIAVAIVRRLLSRYRVAFAETTTRYAEHVARQRWAEETRQAISAAFMGSSRTSHGETIYLRAEQISGKVDVCAIYGVHLDLRGLSRDQALHILTYLEETREQRQQALCGR